MFERETPSKPLPVEHVHVRHRQERYNPTPILKQLLG